MFNTGRGDAFSAQSQEEFDWSNRKGEEVTERTDLVPMRAQKSTFRREDEPSSILTSTVGSERASRKPRRLPVMAASKRAFDFAGSFGLGGGEGITGPPTAGLGPWPRGSSGEDS